MEIYSDKARIQKRRRVFRIKLYFIGFFIALILIGLFYLVVCSSVFQIKDLAIKNNKLLSDSDVLAILKQNIIGTDFGGIAGFKNILAWPSGYLKVSNPAVSDFNIKKQWFKRIITVEVNERERFAIWCTAESKSCYWIDREGLVFADAPITEGSLVFTVFDSQEGDLFPGAKVEEDRFVANLISILENFHETGFEINKIKSDRALKEIRITTSNGPLFIFSTRFDCAKNFALIKDLNFKNTEYVDLTVDDKIYYKNIK